jgi:hypothetical protein
VRQALGSLTCLGRRCLSRIIWTNGGQHRSWSAEYFLHSRCQWEPQQLFQPILKRGLAYCPQRLVGVALDDTKLRKTGRSIQQAFYQRDPLSPPFHVNLVLGLRFLQGSLLLPLHRTANVGTRALSIRFQEVSRVKRPGKKASPEQLKQYKVAVKQKNLSHSFVHMGKQLRVELDLARGRDKILVLTGDGSFCNRTCFGDVADRSALLVRARKDAKLCFRASLPTRRFFALENLLPNRFANRRVGFGRRPGSSTAASVARFATKSSGTSIGSAEPLSALFASLFSPLLPTGREKAEGCIIAIRLTC